MHNSAKGPTKAERDRVDRFREVGCLPCRKVGVLREPTNQHTLDGGRRIGHAATYPSCPWHHQGQPMGKASAKATEFLIGPSVALDTRKFHAAFGTEAELVAETDRLLALPPHELAAMTAELRGA